MLNSQSTGNRIGAKLLNYAIVTIDYLHSKFYADPFTMQTDMAEKSWPLAPSIADGKIIIGLVWDKFKDTVKPGTLILAIDGVSTEGIDMCYLVTQKSLLSDKEKAVLTLKDDKGVISKLEIVKE